MPENKLTHQSLCEGLPPELTDAINKLKESGFSVYTCVMLFLQYGTGLVNFVAEIIDAFKPAQQIQQKAAAQATKAKKAGCPVALGNFLCETQCNLVHALVTNHLACEEAGCCPIEPDEPDGPEPSPKPAPKPAKK